MFDRFPDELVVRKRNGSEWDLLAPFRFYSARLGWVRVPQGFTTDLASVPWFARWYVSRDGEHTKPAVVHDWLYSRASEADHPDITRRDADVVFWQALAARGIRPGAVWVLYLAVRLGGAGSFRRR